MSASLSHTHALSPPLPLSALRSTLRHRSVFLSPRPHRSRCSHSPRRHSRGPRSIRARHQPRAASSQPLGSRPSTAASVRSAAKGRRSAPKHHAPPTQPIRKPLHHPPFEGLPLLTACCVDPALPCLDTPYTRHPLIRVWGLGAEG
jgi:hypothetical protein